MEYDITQKIKDLPEEIYVDKFKIFECKLEYEVRGSQGLVSIRMESNFSEYKAIRDCPFIEIMQHQAVDYLAFAVDDLLGRYLSGIRDCKH